MPIVAASGNGTHPSTKANRKNNSGYIVNAGAVVDTLVRGLSVASLADDTGKKFGSLVLAKSGTGANTTDRFGIQKALAGSSGTLAYNSLPTEWLMKGVGVTKKMSGVDNSGIFFAAADWNGAEENYIHAINSSRQLGSGDLATFDFYANPNGTINPNFTKPGNAGAVTTYATDHAATPTRALPGELTFRFGGALPSGTFYKAKDTREV